MRPASRPRRTAGPGRDGLSRAYAAPKIAPFCTWSAKPMGRQSSPRVTSLPRISTSSYLESKTRWSSACSSVITTVATAPATAPRKLVCRIGLIALRRPGISKDGAHDEHPPARDEMCQVVRQALDVFARLLFETLHLDDLCDQHVIGLTDRLPGYVRRPRETPVRHRVQRPADDVPILRHQTLEVFGQLGGAQLKPHEKGRRRTHPRSVMHSRTWVAPGLASRAGVSLSPERSTPATGEISAVSAAPANSRQRFVAQAWRGLDRRSSCGTRKTSVK